MADADARDTARIRSALAVASRAAAASSGPARMRPRKPTWSSVSCVGSVMCGRK